MPRHITALPAGIRVTDKVTFGQLAKIFPAKAIKQALSDEDKETKRERDLPNHVVVYFIMMLALFREASHTEVLRCVYEGLQWLVGPIALRVTGKSGISQARSRVGWRPLKRLFESIAKPLAQPGDRGAFYRGHRIVAIDGTLFNVPDTAENQNEFGRPSNQNSCSGFPQVRMVGLLECGTHAFFRSEIGGYATAEQVLAPSLLQCLQSDMVCLADRNFMNFTLFQEAQKTGAKIVWRVNDYVKLPAEARLEDGSYLAKLYWYRDTKRASGVQVRVVEYRVGEKEKPIRLVTNWFDHNDAPAEELARLYHERWEIENTLDEIKTHLNANACTLRSRTPDLVKQEILGLLMGHYAIRGIMHEAASCAQIDDDELSFTHSLKVIRRRLPMFGNFPPRANSFVDDFGDFATTQVL